MSMKNYMGNILMEAMAQSYMFTNPNIIPKKQEVFYTNKEIAFFVNQYNLILIKKSNLSRSKREWVKIQIKILKSKGLVSNNI